jgi:hypothetical protein
MHWRGSSPRVMSNSERERLREELTNEVLNARYGTQTCLIICVLYEKHSDILQIKKDDWNRFIVLNATAQLHFYSLGKREPKTQNVPEIIGAR